MKFWARVEVHWSVAVPEPVIVFGVIVPQVRPVGTVSVRNTIPVNPLTGETVIVEVSCEPGLPEALVAAIVKSVTWNVAVVE